MTGGLFSLDGRVAVVTGGSGVLGGGIARGLAGAGAKVAVLGRREDRAAAVAQDIEAAGGVGEEDDGQLFVWEQGRKVTLGTLIARGIPVEHAFVFGGKRAKGSGGLMGFDEKPLMIVRGKPGPVSIVGVGDRAFAVGYATPGGARVDRFDRDGTASPVWRDPASPRPPALAWSSGRLLVAHYHGERNHQGIGNELIQSTGRLESQGPVRRHPGLLRRNCCRWRLGADGRHRRPSIRPDQRPD